MAPMSHGLGFLPRNLHRMLIAPSAAIEFTPLAFRLKMCIFVNNSSNQCFLFFIYNVPVHPQNMMVVTIEVAPVD